MVGLSGVPNGTSSQTKHKDGIYAICCLVPQGTHTKVLQIVFRDANMTRGVLQTWKDTDSSKMQTFDWLEIPHFLNRISGCIST